jgi:hypothetical protein
MEDIKKLEDDIHERRESQLGAFLADTQVSVPLASRQWHRAIYKAPENRDPGEPRPQVPIPYRPSIALWPRGPYTPDRLGDNKITSDGPQTTIAPLPWDPPKWEYPRGALRDWGQKSALQIYLACLRQQLASEYQRKYEMWQNLALNMMYLHRALIEVNVLLKLTVPQSEALRQRPRISMPVHNMDELYLSLNEAGYHSHTEAIMSAASARDLIVSASRLFTEFEHETEIDTWAIPLHSLNPATYWVLSQRRLVNPLSGGSTVLSLKDWKAFLASFSPEVSILSEEDDSTPFILSPQARRELGEPTADDQQSDETSLQDH